MATRRRLSPERFRSFPPAARTPGRFGGDFKTGRDLLVLDAAAQAALRRRVLAECREAQAELESLKELERAFEEKDRPAFFGWMHSTFAALMGRIRTCFKEIAEKQELIDEVEAVSQEFELEYPEAYRIVLKRRRAMEKEAPEQEMDDDFSSTAEDSFGGEESEFGQEYSNAGDAYDDFFTASKKATPVASDILKQLYRDLARKLHPDAGFEQDQRTRELWLEVQQAYVERDLKRMQALAALCLSGSSGPSGSLRSAPSVGELAELTRDLRKAAKALKKRLEKVRRSDPAWAFSEAGAQPGLKTQTKRELQAELREAQDVLERLNQVIEVLFEAA